MLNKWGWHPKPLGFRIRYIEGNDMAMTRKQNRAILIITGLSILFVAVGISIYALKDATDFFVLPSQIEEKNIKPGVRVRLGGLVKKGSVVRGEGTLVKFEVTDKHKAMKVTFNDILPDLFKEGQGVIAVGKLQKDGTFKADKVLAKHDEKYTPRSLSDELKKQGLWKHNEGQASN